MFIKKLFITILVTCFFFCFGKNVKASKMSDSKSFFFGLNVEKNEIIKLNWFDFNDLNFGAKNNRINFKVAGILLNSSPTAPSISPSGNVSICNGTSQTITISGAATGAIFQWKKNGTDIPGATNSTYTATVAATYTCVVTEGTVVSTLGSLVLSVLSLPSVTVSASDNSICLGFSSTLTASGANSYVWSPSSATTNLLTVNPSVTTTYTVTGTGSNGCKNSASTTITVNPNPATPPIIATPTTICSGGSIAFSTTAIAGQIFSWDFGDGSTDGAGTSVNHTYNLASTGNGSQNFTVTLTTTIGATGCKSTRSQQVTVKQLPDASIGDFSDNTPFSICNGEGLNYIEVTNLSTSSNTNYLINWGDASANFTATGTWLLNTGIAAHNYTSSGYFILSFTVTGNNGCTNTKTYNIYKGSNPSVPFSNPGNTVNLCAPYTLTLPSQTATNPIGTVYIVTVNDGSPVETFTTLPAQYTHTFNTASCGATGGITPNTFFVTIRAQNPCGFSDFTVQPIAVSKKPIANFTISPDTIICKNESVIITNTTIAGVTVNNSGVCNYTSPNNWVISPSTGWTLNSGNSLGDLFPDNDPSTWGSSNLGVTFNRSGTYVISNFVRNFCGTDTIKKTIYVNAITLSSSVGTDLQNVCINTPINNISYRFSNVQSSVTVSGLPTGVTGVYNSITKTFAISGTPSVSGVFNYTVSAVASCGDVNTVSGTIRSVIKPSILSSSFTNPIFCASTTGSIALNGLNLSTSYSVFYSYNSIVQTITLNSNSSGTINISNLPAGTYSNVFVVLNNCSSASVGPFTLLNPNGPATPTVSSNGPICSGQTLNLTASTTSIGTTTWSWTGPNGFASTLQNPSIVNATTSASGTYTVTATINGCTSNSNSVVVSVSSTLSAPTVISPILYCQNSFSTPLTATAISGASLKWYTVSSGGTASTTAPTPSTSTVGSTTYFVSQSTASGCESSRSSIIVNTKSTPSITAIPTNPTSCGTTNGSILINGLAASTSHQLNYTFNATPVSATVASSATGTYTISNLASGTYSSITVTLSGCVSNTIASIVLTGNSSTATPIITGNGTICAGQLLLLTATTSTTGGTVTYTWTGPNGIMQTGTTNSIAIVNTTAQSAGLYSVTASVNNCNSAAATKTVIIKSPTTSTTNASICSGQSFTFNGVVYNSAGVYSTTLSNALGCDSIAILNLSVAAAVTTTPSAILGAININRCDTLQTYRVNPFSGVVFVWTVTGMGNYVKNGQGTNLVSLVMKSAGIVSVVATNSCGFTSSATKLTIIKSVPTTPGVIYQKISPKLITANANVCMYNQAAFASTNQADTFMIKSVANARGYYWKTPTGSIVNRINDTTIAVIFSNTIVLPDTIKVYSISECDTSIAKSLPLTRVLATSPVGIYKSFAANITTGTTAITSVCSLVGGGVETYKIRKIATATSYNWSLRIGTNAIITHLNPLGINDTAITVRYNTGFTKDTISVISVNGCGVSVAKTLAVSAILIPPTPTTIVASSGNFNPCIGNVVQYTVSSTTPFSTQSAISVYRWTRPTYSTIISSNADSSIISVRFDIGYVGGSLSVKGQSACGIAGTAKPITLLYLPPTPTSITSSTGLYNSCIGNSITYTVVAPAPSATQLSAIKYRWTKPNFTTITSATLDSSSITVSFNTGYVGGSLTVKGQTACGAFGTAKTQGLTHTACALGTKISDSTISESLQKMDLKILPNPTTTEFNIQLISPFKELANIKVMDLQGRVIQKLKTKSFDKINVGNNFKPGVYLIEVNQGSQKMTYRAVKF